mmetsp:Transcript_17130/g.54740  ORF Transcript_17130/g.54740 Transcript_17130/m.54740 type:complete len:230 (+) Transcript_17130:596-1285(+)
MGLVAVFWERPPEVVPQHGPHRCRADRPPHRHPGGPPLDPPPRLLERLQQPVDEGVQHGVDYRLKQLVLGLPPLHLLAPLALPPRADDGGSCGNDRREDAPPDPRPSLAQHRRRRGRQGAVLLEEPLAHIHVEGCEGGGADGYVLGPLGRLRSTGLYSVCSLLPRTHECGNGRIGRALFPGVIHSNPPATEPHQAATLFVRHQGLTLHPTQVGAVASRAMGKGGRRGGL